MTYFNGQILVLKFSVHRKVVKLRYFPVFYPSYFSVTGIRTSGTLDHSAINPAWLYWPNFTFLNFQFIEKFNEVREATRTSTKPNGTTPTTSASASPVATRASAVANKSDFGNVAVAGSIVSNSNSVMDNNQQVQRERLSPRLLT